MSAAAFLIGAAFLLQGESGWTCEAPVVLGEYRGWVSREFFPWKGDHSPYKMKIALPGPGDRHEIWWTIDPRPQGRRPGARRLWPNPRRFSGAFRDGPDMVRIDFYWGPEAVAPIWSHYWGDGLYAGADLEMSVRMMRHRRATNTSPFGSEGGLISRKLLRKLSTARTWKVVVIDGAGAVRSSETFPVPTWREAETAFVQARAKIDSVELRYRKRDPLPESDASCTDHPDPAGIVRLLEPARIGPARL
ncbi:MAG TPA: hypothetical protein VF574_02715 [Allosphingosinicella sp.]|jgi:hypothetical protein